jgi:ribosome-binding protein aMBF1 (putative translation factor)
MPILYQLRTHKIESVRLLRLKMQHIQHRRLTTRLQAPIVTIQESRQVIGERMREARLNCGLSQGSIAEMLHCDQTTISRMERGQISPDCAQIRILSSIFQLSILYLLGYPTFVVSAVNN